MHRAGEPKENEQNVLSLCGTNEELSGGGGFSSNKQ